MKEVATDAKVAADVTSDLRLKNAFIRRGLAFDQGNVMSFATHEKLVSLPFTEYMREAPPGFSKVSQDQLMRADKEVFRRLQERTRAGIRPALDGSRPVDTHMQSVLDSAAVQMLLLPLRGSGGGPKRERDDSAAAHVPTPAGTSKAAKKQAKKKVASSTWNFLEDLAGLQKSSDAEEERHWE